MSTGADTLMTIGRWKGCLYKEIPHDYGRWAVKETERTANSSPELIMYAGGGTTSRTFSGEGHPGEHQRLGGLATAEPSDSVVKGILGTGDRHPHKRVSWDDRQGEHEAVAEARKPDCRGEQEGHDGGGEPGADRGDPQPGDEARPGEGQGPGISLSGEGDGAEKAATTAGGGRMCSNVGCCGHVTEDEIITEEEYVRAWPTVTRHSTTSEVYAAGRRHRRRPSLCYPRHVHPWRRPWLDAGNQRV